MIRLSQNTALMDPAMALEEEEEKEEEEEELGRRNRKKRNKPLPARLCTYVPALAGR